MGHTSHLSNFIHGVKIANSKFKSCFSYEVCTKSILHLARFLYREGLISSYTHRPSAKFKHVAAIDVYLRYTERRRPLIAHVRTFASPSHPRHYTVKKIRSLQRRSLSFALSFYVFSTAAGIRSGKECVDLNIGGNLLCSINYDC